MLGKTHRVKYTTSVHKTKEFLNYVHLDIWGLAQVTFLGGAKYFMSMFDDFSKKVWIYFLKSKDQVLKTFKT